MTRYRPNYPRDFLAATDFLNYAKEQNIEIVLDRYSPPRSGQQNRYLYFCLAYFAHLYGCTEVEAKEVFLKQYACPQIFQQWIDVKGQRTVWYRSTADLTKEEMSMAIRNFRAYAEINGIDIPDATDSDNIRRCQQEMNSTKHFR